MEERIDLVDAEFWARNPHEEFAWLRQHAPVWRDPRHGVWAVSTYELVKQVSSLPGCFSNAGGIRPDQDPAPNMVDMDDPEHWKRRKLVNRGFTPKRVREQEAAIRRTVRVLLDAVAGREECDLVWDIAAWLPLIVIGDALGVEPPDREQLLRWSDDLMGMLGSKDPDALETAMKAWAGFYEYASQVIADRKDSPTEDLMSVLVHAEVDGDRFEDHEIIAESLLILIGGDETTRHVISGGTYQLLAEPQRWHALAQDTSLLPGAIEEMLRWVSPVKNMARQATTDIELGGQMIPAGEKLLLVYPSANRDETVFSNPNEFDLRRSPNDHIAFGFGTHFCLGSSLARLELRVVFEEMVARFPDMELIEQKEPRYRPANFVTGYETLRVRLGQPSAS